MLKAFYFLWRRSSMSRQQFVEYYENFHCALIDSHIPPQMDFRRHFPIWQGREGELQERGPAGPFDAMTAITYFDRDSFARAQHVYHSAPFNAIVTEDETQFLQREYIRLVVVDERTGHDGTWRAAPHGGGAKVLRFVWRPAGMTAVEFRQSDSRDVSTIRQRLKGCLELRRNFLLADDAIGYCTPALTEASRESHVDRCDLIEEFWFAKVEDAAAALQAFDSGGADDVFPPSGSTVLAVECEQYVSSPRTEASPA